MVQYSTVQYSTAQYNTVQYSTVLYSAVQYSTVQYSTVHCSTVLHQNGHRDVLVKLNLKLHGVFRQFNVVVSEHLVCASSDIIVSDSMGRMLLTYFKPCKDLSLRRLFLGAE